jgi:alpha-beta hydrolase superfamily lysophospholipase
MGDKPIFVLGNSMGGLLAVKTCAAIRPSGLVLLAPAFAGHPKLFPVSYQLSGLVKALMAPNKEIVMPYGTDLITKQEQVRTWLDNNGDIRLAVPGKILIDLLFLTQSTRMKKIRLPCPLFMITAGQDTIVDNQASELIFRQINAPAKKKINIHKAMHDLTLDLALDQVADLLIEWSGPLIQNKDRLKAVSNQRDK